MKKVSTAPTKKNVSSNRSERSVFFKIKSALYLKDGSIFEGYSPSWQQDSYSGEVVFNTGMTGYVESLTDPSYADQILVFTYPMIGNYGVNPAEIESSRIQVQGVVIGDVATHYSHSNAKLSLIEWLQAQGIPLLSGVDTRSLTKHLRQSGSMLGSISNKPVSARKLHLDPHFVSIEGPQIYNAQHSKKIILVDCGMKENILRKLMSLPYQIKRVPYDFDYTKETYDGIFISNGPGNPEDYIATITHLRSALRQQKPIFGICLGNQLLALAAGAKTYKLKFGHRGHNQPCMQMNNKHCYITSQNHGYAIDETSLPRGWKVAFRNLNDDSVEGIEHISKPFFSVQFHPEAAPGPTDTEWLFKRFTKLI